MTLFNEKPAPQAGFPVYSTQPFNLGASPCPFKRKRYHG